MKRIIFALLLTLPLAGCWNPFGSIENPLNKTSLVAVEASYGSALSIASGYKDACARKTIPPSCRSVVKSLQNADNYAYGQIKVARDFIKANPTVDASVVISTAQQAVRAFQDAQTANGVK